MNSEASDSFYHHSGPYTSTTIILTFGDVDLARGGGQKDRRGLVHLEDVDSDGGSYMEGAVAHRQEDEVRALVLCPAVSVLECVALHLLVREVITCMKQLMWDTLWINFTSNETYTFVRSTVDYAQ